jgi:ATP-dependent Clp protease ATP-binding subunit ClpA
MKTSIERVIQRQLTDKPALKLLEREFVEGDVVRADAEGGELAFERAAGRAESTPE